MAHKSKVPTLEEVQALSDEEAIAVEAELVEQTDNGPKADDGKPNTDKTLEVEA